MRALNRVMHRLRVVLLAAIVVAGFGTGFTNAPAFAQESWDCANYPHTPVAVEASPTAEGSMVEVIPFPEGAGEVTIYAAASLTAVFTAIEADLETANPGLDLVFSFAGSQVLVTQLAEGAPADVFASANNSQMSNAINEGVVAGEPVEFARNKLAIVVPADNPAGVKSLADLNNEGVSLVIAAADVPVGGYARTAICAAGATDLDGDDFTETVASNVVSNESNVRSVLTKVALGEADAGIVYETDITPDHAGDVIKIDIPAEFNVIASYPIVAVEDGNTEAAAAFISFVTSPAGQAVLAEYGFS